MANIVFNIAKGRVLEYFERVNNNDPANSAIILVPLETSGLESDATLIDADTLAAVLSGTTNEQSTMGRKTLTDSDLSAITVDDGADTAYAAIPAVTWTAATGNAISKILICYDSDTTGGTDSNIIPLTMHDASHTPSGIDFTINAGTVFTAS